MMEYVLLQAALGVLMSMLQGAGIGIGFALGKAIVERRRKK